MLLSFTVTNFKSIKDAQTLRLTSEGNNKIHSSNIAFPDKNKKIATLRTIAIYGANASGKSNIIQALQSLRNLVLTSRKNDPEDSIEGYNPFKLSDETKNAPTEIELEFIGYDQLRYIYSIMYDKTKIIKESLSYYPNGKMALLFERNEKELKFGSSLTGTKKVDFNENQSYLSVLANIDGSDMRIKKTRGFFRKIDVYDPQTSASIHASLKDDDFRLLLANLLACADTGIYQIDLEENSINEDEFLKNLPSHFPQKIKEMILDSEKYEPVFLHNRSNEKFFRSDESDGTLRLLDLAGPIFKNIIKAGIFVIDEMDCRLHPKIVRMIIEFFNDAELSKNAPQLIFTTHNTNLMDQNLFRRDQIFFTQKKKSGKTQLYSLADFNDVRATTVFEKWYNEGSFDAVPRLNFFDLKSNFLKFKNAAGAEDDENA